MKDDQYWIRQANADDVEALIKIGSVTFEEAFGDDNDPEDMRNYLSLSFNHEVISGAMKEGSVFYMAGLSQSVAGYIKLNPNATNEKVGSLKSIQLERIYVMRSYYGKGLGIKLLNTALDYANEKGYEYIWLGVWQENKRAIQFYLKNNFEIVGTKLFKIGNRVTKDFVMLRKV